MSNECSGYQAEAAEILTDAEITKQGAKIGQGRPDRKELPESCRDSWVTCTQDLSPLLLEGVTQLYSPASSDRVGIVISMKVRG